MVSPPVGSLIAEIERSCAQPSPVAGDEHAADLRELVRGGNPRRAPNYPAPVRSTRRCSWTRRVTSPLVASAISATTTGIRFDPAAYAAVQAAASEARALTLSTGEGGMLWIRGVLDPEGG